MRINGTTALYGLMGHPVEHSFSPFLQNLFAKKIGKNMVYVTFNVDEGQLESAVEGLRALNIKGVNVTVPYKVEIMQYLDHIDEVARNIGAVNTIKVENDQLIGYNTDWLGLLASLNERDVYLKDKSVLIIGAGGGARAVAVMCAKEGAKKITITNRTLSKAKDLCALIESQYQIETETVHFEALKERTDLRIAFQTTSVGMYPHIENNPVYETKFYKTLDVAIDLIYNPIETHFLKEAREAGALTINGLGMLFHQGIIAFELWHGLKMGESIKDTCYNVFLDEIVNAD